MRFNPNDPDEILKYYHSKRNKLLLTLEEFEVAATESPSEIERKLILSAPEHLGVSDETERYVPHILPDEDLAVYLSGGVIPFIQYTAWEEDMEMVPVRILESHISKGYGINTNVASKTVRHALQESPHIKSQSGRVRLQPEQSETDQKIVMG